MLNVPAEVQVTGKVATKEELRRMLG